MLAKFGVKVQLAKVGAYKSAPEMFTSNKMSDANREQVSAYINGLWGEICKSVSESRKISVKNLNTYADNFISISPSEDFVKYKFVDKLLYTDQVKEIIKKKLKIDDDEDINQLSLSDMKNVKGGPSDGDEVAVYYAYGEVVSGSSSAISSGNVIDAEVVCKDLEKLQKDSDVKAVVMRINSGGGSAYASEQIWHSVMMLKAHKPVVVSMGGRAASGAYYMSAPADWIVAEPTTITGSIGIFGMFPDFSGLLTDKLGVKFDEVKTNKNSGFGTTTRPFTPEEMSYINSYIDRGYKLFRGRVAEGRKMKVNDVEKIAQGRIWLGKDAIGIKLVDQLGDIDAAIAKAAKLAKLGKDYYTSSYPAPESWYEQLLNNKKGSYLDEQMHATLGELYTPFMMLKNMNRENAIQARITSEVSVK
jgi:protease-4